MSVNQLEKRITNIGGVATAEEYEKLGEAAIKYQTYADLPSDLQKLLTTLEEKAGSES